MTTKPQNELERQIEKGFDYRGNVTITLADDSSIEGFLFNRKYSPEPKAGFIEVFLAGSGDRAKYALDAVSKVELTGEDCAAGKSYAEWLAKKQTSGNAN